jgi:non-ribosomal peptide synthetase component F
MLHRLELLAQRENATLFMLLLASLQTLLARYTQRTEIAVGTVVANRPSMDAESLLGNFSNRLLLRGNLAGNPTFRQLLRRVRGSTRGHAPSRPALPRDAGLYQ